MKKIENINDYIPAGDAAKILTEKLGRPIRVDYLNKMTRRKRDTIRFVHQGDRILYHRSDIANCTIAQRVRL